MPVRLLSQTRPIPRSPDGDKNDMQMCSFDILNFLFHVQKNAYPWIAALLQDGDIDSGYINSQCSAVLVMFSFSFSDLFFSVEILLSQYNSPQIGNRFAVTAAHCLFNDYEEEMIPATSFSIMLGVHNRRNTREARRWQPLTF